MIIDCGRRGLEDGIGVVAEYHNAARRDRRGQKFRMLKPVALLPVTLGRPRREGIGIRPQRVEAVDGNDA